MTKKLKKLTTRRLTSIKIGAYVLPFLEMSKIFLEVSMIFVEISEGVDISTGPEISSESKIEILKFSNLV